MKIRPYAIADRQACLDILEGNTPEYFLREDLALLDGFLLDLPGPYVVAEEVGAIIACGGWAGEEDGAAVLTWGMVQRSHHRQGIGRSLLRHRIEAIRVDTTLVTLRLRTIQQVQGFFAREGFRVVEVVPDGYGPGFDRVTMELRLRGDVDQAT